MFIKTINIFYFFVVFKWLQSLHSNKFAEILFLNTVCGKDNQYIFQFSFIYEAILDIHKALCAFLFGSLNAQTLLRTFFINPIFFYSNCNKIKINKTKLYQINLVLFQHFKHFRLVLIKY